MEKLLSVPARQKDRVCVRNLNLLAICNKRIISKAVSSPSVVAVLR